MKIDPNFSTGSVGSAENDQATRTSPKTANPYAVSSGGPGADLSGAVDTVSFSGTINQLQQLKVQLAQTPEIRSARVAALQQQISQGTYNPSNQQIATAMFEDSSSANQR